MPKYLLLLLVSLSGCVRSFAKLAEVASAEQKATGSIRLIGTLAAGDESTTLTARAAIRVSFVDVSPDVTMFRLANEPSFAGSEFQAVPDGSVEWILNSGSGVKTVYAQLRTQNG